MTIIDLRDRDVDKWTLRLVVQRGILAFECRNCSHLSQLDVLELIARFGADAIVGDVLDVGCVDRVGFDNWCG